MKKIMLPVLFISAICCSFLSPDLPQHNNKFVYVTSATGDLNKDKIPDSVVVLENKSSDPSPYLLKIFFKDSSGNYKQVVSTDSAIDLQHKNMGDNLENIEIKNNVLTINFSLLRGSIVHKFRYQNGNFELIGYKLAVSDGNGTMTTTEFNLSTGRYTHLNERYYKDEVISKRDKIVKLRPLPNLHTYNADKASFSF